MQIRDFRNLQEVFLEFPAGTQLLAGANAQGKTSLLEAIYFLATATSHRATTNRELIRRAASAAFLSAVYEKEGQTHSVSIGFDEKERKIRVDEELLKKSSDLYGHLKAVFFSPEDMDFFNGGPAFRRRTLDLGLCQKKPSLVRQLLEYKKILKQRNALIKGRDQSPLALRQIGAWNGELARCAGIITHERAKYALGLLEKTAQHYGDLARAQETLSGSYRASGAHQTWKHCAEVPTAETLSQACLASLEASSDRDMACGHTTCGPHRDDLSIEIGGADAEKYASQGQKRSLALSLKIAERDMLAEAGEQPLLLVDDVTHEMDRERCRIFLNKAIESGQTILTFTEEEAHRGLLSGATVWQVRQGQFSLKQPL